MPLDLKPLADAEKRRELIGEWESGSFETYQEAEAEAVRLGIPPLARRVDWTRFKVDELDTWTLEMSLAWILWRDYAKVAEFHASYRERSTRWKKTEIKGRSTVANPFGDTVVVSTRWDLMPLDPPSFGVLGVAVAAAKSIGAVFADDLQDVNDARDKLWKALFDKRLTATGTDPEAGWQTIPNRQWSTLIFAREFLSTDLVNRDKTKKVEYSNVELARSEVVALWPPIPGVIEDEAQVPIVEAAAEIMPGEEVIEAQEPALVDEQDAGEDADAADPAEFRLSAKQMDIQAAIKACFFDRGRPVPNATSAVREEANAYLIENMGYRVGLSLRSYERYVEKLAKIEAARRQ